MTKVNLLPWREQERREKKQEFFILLAAAMICTSLLIVPVYLGISVFINDQEDRNRMLSLKIADLDKQIIEIKDLKQRKAQLLARMEVIQRLQTDRTNIVRLYDELVLIIPEDVHLLKLVSQDGRITITGRAEANTAIAKMMRNIESSEEFYEPVLHEIKNKTLPNKINTSEFIIEMKSKMNRKDSDNKDQEDGF